MEQISGVDVSWMTHGGVKDKSARTATRKRAASTQQARDTPPPSPTPTNQSTNTGVETAAGAEAAPVDVSMSSPATPTTAPKPISPSRPGFTRAESGDKKNGTTGTSPRRGSWFSNISSKFSSSPTAQAPAQANAATPPKQSDPAVPKIQPNKNAVLQHAIRNEGNAPYTPAPPKSGQGSILHVFRRLSYSNNTLSPAVKGSHGLVERKVLNVDRHRERCPISDLDQSRLRRVAFCVDVEIAPMPRYADPAVASEKATGDKVQRRKLAEKGEGDALKHPKAVEEQKENDGTVKASGELLPKEPEKEGNGEAPGEKLQFRENVTEVSDDKGTGTDAKKKEKKKKSEEERRARKEKKRKLAEANGTVPLELHLDSDSSSPGTPGSEPAKTQTQANPTINPVRIYRRCCQLRETPILKKITEQLLDSANTTERGVVDKLDLTGYWMQLADLVTLGDFLAVVPVKEVILENCGLTDEGLRVVLAGLLAAKSSGPTRRKPFGSPDGLVQQGGVVERLVLSNNKIGPDGWKHLSLFIYLCRSLKALHLSGLPFPQRPQSRRTSQTEQAGRPKLDLCVLFSRSIGERLAGSTLELLNLGETSMNNEQLGNVLDGVIKCGIKRLGLAHNNIDAEGVQHVAKYLRSGLCEGLDLGGNDLRELLQDLAAAISPDDPLYALSLADANLKPGSLCKLLGTLAKLKNFRFIDLSHNHDLFELEPTAISVLRRYLPKMPLLKRIHLADCALTAEHVITIAEIIPEIPELAHINLLENPEITKLADARTEEAQEEACALYASLLAATRVSTSLVSVEIDVPTEGTGELVRALARQIVAYCLRNLERLSVGDLSGAATAAQQGGALAKPDPQYPDVLQHLVGHDVAEPDGPEDQEAAPDEDYVIGGTGIVRALATCLKNRGDESRRQSGEFIREVETGTVVPRSKLPPGRAKDMSKHLLFSARKIRHRLQPAIAKVKATSSGEGQAYHRLLFLERTLDGIIKRFEDEFPETREHPTAAPDAVDQVAGSLSSAEADLDAETLQAEAEDLDQDQDAEDETELLPDGTRPSPPRHNSSSALSTTLKAITNEEGRVLRAGHKFRSNIIRPDEEQYDLLLLSGLDDIGSDPKHARVLTELLDELGDADLSRQAEEVGAVRVFEEHKDRVRELMQAMDPDHWRVFAESQEKARANVKVGGGGDDGGAGDGVDGGSKPAKDVVTGTPGPQAGETGAVQEEAVVPEADEVAVEDD